MKVSSTKVITKGILILFSFLFLIWFLYQTKEVLLLLFASFVIASALLPIVDTLNKKMSRGFAVFTVYLLGLIIMTTILVPFFILIIEQTQEFIGKLPEYLSEIDRFVTKIALSTQNLGMLPDLSTIVSSSTGIGQNIISQSINITINVFAGLVASITLATIILFMLLDTENLKNGFLKLFPKQFRNQAEQITITIAGKVGGYVRGQLLIMILTGIATALGLMLIGVEFSALLGLLAGVLEIVPIVGPNVAAAVAVVVALAKSPMLAVWTILVFIIVQTLQNRLLAPIVYSKFLDMHPLILIVALLFAATTLGVTGVILSPAIAAAVYVLVQELYIKRINQE